MTKTHIAKKRFGQNFLHDEYIINEIIKIINPKSTDFMVEIGPGLGALTVLLLNKVGKLDVIEIDRDIISILHKEFDNQITIHGMDALKFDYSFGGNLVRVVGNLPYNISTPLLFHLAQFKNIKDMHFMLQKEVVDRICAKPGNKDYGRLSVMLQCKFACDKMLDVAATCFKPQPKVESAIVRLKPLGLDKQYKVDEGALNKIVTHAFNMRRKTISNSLRNIINPKIFAKLGIDTNMRAENLSVDQYVALANEIDGKNICKNN
ncbi:MAG: rRNA ((1518)-N(6)/adenine(1519)-N(6))-dimethyltransferase [Burkholderiales bacterium]|jgi:16S rRNA (adenine1518-N6/adenine1519-N6)-dimethyltransferase|nr:rRNA ((1518)-N(6)/adenine(1519)-N(6))-dimethyltransferase [Burkholderiales bacterium]